ncbi:hypothetical protein F0562_019100 [Nyssa sinensis]|uniref:Ycf20-like protein n=1 Tax=Nyssa sinensis TaxID=561372 RepID=A0A5J4ZF06_9ASTE|nr:hypothetical protein F0562_019100 [Nyssa sinensis]
MVMATNMPTPSYSENAKFSTAKCFRSKFPSLGLLDCIHNTAFAFGKGLYSQLRSCHVVQPSLVKNSKSLAWSVRSSADGSRLDPSPMNDTSSGTRLNTAIQTIQIKLNARIKEIRRSLPVKLLFFLVGVYCATVFATVIGQTGGWDILSAALAVALVEGIGALMYRASLPLFDKVNLYLIKLRA